VFSTADTIVALATAPVRAGIGVVRISGSGAHAVARAILAVPHDFEPRHATLTHVRAAGARSPWSPGSSDPGLIDEVVATYFPAPHSYTSEDVVEISAHGSVALLREIVRAAIDAGARLAEPGEFTLRAFLNGRLDLVQAEAVADLVDAATPLQARVAFDQLEGTLTRAIGALDQELFDLAARLEASVDFPDEGYHFVAPGEAAETLGRVGGGIDALLATSAVGRVIREGRHIAILGKPNVGKSSLFNQLVGTDRAIVAPGPGTTRDMLLETLDLDGIRLGLVDTAGIRASDDEVEQEGVARARRAAGVADLVVLVLDQSRPLEDIDRALLHETASAPRVVAVNKTDLTAQWTIDELARSQRAGTASLGPAEVRLSLKTGAGLDDLRAAMRAALDVSEPLRDAPMVTNVRHETLLREARTAVARASKNLEQAGESASEELVLADLAEARRALEEVTGRRTSEDVLRRIFERFCIGK
jgi:tRNA modification GTPase